MAAPVGTGRLEPPRRGRGRLVAEAVDGRTELREAHATAPVRWIRTTAGTAAGGVADAAVVCWVTLGAGLVDGDVADLTLEVGPGATLVVFTQASTKVFRGASRQTLEARVEGCLVLVPDPVAPFAGARFEQTVDVELVGAGGVVVLDGFTAGRPASGERWAFDRLALRTRLTRDGVLLANDATLLEPGGATGAEAEPAELDPLGPRFERFEAFLTVLAAGRAAEPFAQAARGLGAPPPSASLVSTVAPLPGGTGLVARIAADRADRALADARRYFGNLEDIGAVDPFRTRR